MGPPARWSCRTRRHEGHDRVLPRRVQRGTAPGGSCRSPSTSPMSAGASARARRRGTGAGGRRCGRTRVAASAGSAVAAQRRDRVAGPGDAAATTPPDQRHCHREPGRQHPGSGGDGGRRSAGPGLAGAAVQDVDGKLDPERLRACRCSAQPAIRPRARSARSTAISAQQPGQDDPGGRRVTRGERRTGADRAAHRQAPGRLQADRLVGVVQVTLGVRRG